MMWSEKCIASEYFDEELNECVPCEDGFDILAGFEFIPNCGRSDDGSQHISPYTHCPDGKFNDGTLSHCKQCSTCPAGHLQAACSKTSDSRCCVVGQYGAQKNCSSEPLTTTTTSPVSAKTTTKTPVITIKTTKATVSATTTTKTPVSTNHSIYSSKGVSTPRLHDTAGTSSGVNLHAATFWAVILLLCLCLACVVYIIKKRKYRCRGRKTHVNGKSFKDLNSLEDKPLTSRDDNTDSHKHLLSAEVQAAPLQTVLNNLDVVDELVLLLDPETPGVKNTRHLAANCSLSFAWINYIYSMKEKRSPLVAVLEKVITSHPYWNVGHLADLLSKIGRNDAVAVLGNLTVATEVV